MKLGFSKLFPLVFGEIGISTKLEQIDLKYNVHKRNTT